MDYVTISVEEYNNAVEKGLDIVSYMKGRMDEAKAEVKVLPEPIDIQIDGKTLAKASVPVVDPWTIPITDLSMRIDALQTAAATTATTVANLAQKVETEAAKGLTGIFKPASSSGHHLLLNGVKFGVGDRVIFGDDVRPWTVEEIDPRPVTTLPVRLTRGQGFDCNVRWPSYDELEDLKLIKKS